MARAGSGRALGGVAAGLAEHLGLRPLPVRAAFVLLALNNLSLVLDLVIFVDIDLRLLRHTFALGAVAVLLFGFIWDLDE